MYTAIFPDGDLMQNIPNPMKPQSYNQWKRTTMHNWWMSVKIALWLRIWQDCKDQLTGPLECYREALPETINDICNFPTMPLELQRSLQIASEANVPEVPPQALSRVVTIRPAHSGGNTTLTVQVNGCERGV